MLRSIIKGSGHYLPTNIVNNDFFVKKKFYDSYGKRITKSTIDIINKFEDITEIKTRRYVDFNLNNSDIASFSAEQAINSANIDREMIDYIIVAHNFGDIDVKRQVDIMPSISAKVKHKLGINNCRCKPYDMIFGCPGWIEGVILSDNLIKSSLANNILVIGSDTLSRAYDPYDRSSMIFADGSGAVLLQSYNVGNNVQDKGIINHISISFNGKEIDFLKNDCSINKNYNYSSKMIRMNGRRVYEFVLKYVPIYIKELLDNSDLHINDIDKILLHQANAKMDHAVIERLYKLYNISHPEFICPMTVQYLGNTSVASIPTMYDLIVNGSIDNYSFKNGDIILMASVGAGMNINALLYKF